MRYELEISNTIVNGLFGPEYGVSEIFIGFYENASPNYKTLITGCQALGGLGMATFALASAVMNVCR